MRLILFGAVALLPFFAELVHAKPAFGLLKHFLNFDSPARFTHWRSRPVRNNHLMKTRGPPRFSSGSAGFWKNPAPYPPYIPRPQWRTHTCSDSTPTTHYRPSKPHDRPTIQSGPCIDHHNPTTCIDHYNPTPCIDHHNPTTCIDHYNPTPCIDHHNPTPSTDHHNTTPCIKYYCRTACNRPFSSAPCIKYYSQTTCNGSFCATPCIDHYNPTPCNKPSGPTTCNKPSSSTPCIKYFYPTACNGSFGPTACNGSFGPTACNGSFGPTACIDHYSPTPCNKPSSSTPYSKYYCPTACNRPFSPAPCIKYYSPTPSIDHYNPTFCNKPSRSTPYIKYHCPTNCNRPFNPTSHSQPSGPINCVSTPSVSPDPSPPTTDTPAETEATTTIGTTELPSEVTMTTFVEENSTEVTELPADDQPEPFPGNTVVTEIEEYSTPGNLYLPPSGIKKRDVSEIVPAETTQVKPVPLPAELEPTSVASGAQGADENMVIGVEGEGGSEQMGGLTLAKFVDELLALRAKTKGTAW
ncbi:uncharacterized protein LOC132193682 [Neocloeon triangulifer]|uniref:uncharacterized protein LOC132193682 n=1 Tax=Neocloeon triangulifer TaxID=2078957 RepID=UPI00286F8748|nr:uncharacterized protein LOC132193682 [Neocloeon triangulifer]